MKEAAVTSFCTHWSTVHKHLHLGHNKALPILSLTQMEKVVSFPVSLILVVAGSCHTIRIAQDSIHTSHLYIAQLSQILILLHLLWYT